MCDLDSSLINVEGSPIFDRKNLKLIGIRLPNVHHRSLMVNIALFAPISIILSRAFNLVKAPKIRMKSPYSDVIMKIRDDYLK